MGYNIIIERKKNVVEKRMKVPSKPVLNKKCKPQCSYANGVTATSFLYLVWRITNYTHSELVHQ